MKPRVVLVVPIGGNRTVVLNERKARAISFFDDVIRSFIADEEISSRFVHVDRRGAEPLLSVELDNLVCYTFGKRRARAFVRSMELIREFVKKCDSAKAEKEE